jgi:hypothetical protein
MATANDIYNMIPIRVVNNPTEVIYDLCKYLYSEVPYELLNRYELHLPDIIVKYVVSECLGMDDCWRIGTVWFRNEPVMIIQDAGDDDYENSFVTNHKLFTDMLHYIIAEYTRHVVYTSNDIEPDVDTPKLTNFYGALLTIDMLKKSQEINNEQQLRILATISSTEYRKSFP